MDHIVLNSAKVIGRISASPEKIVLISRDPFTFHYLPELKIDYHESPDVFVEEREQVKPVILEYPHAYISPTPDHRGLVSTCDYLLERARQEKWGTYLLNSSSVQMDGRAVVFFGGATNLGKTTSALELASRNFEFFSDEKTLLHLDEAKLCGGSRSMPLRKKVLMDRIGSKREFAPLEENSCTDPMLAMMILPHMDHGLVKPIHYQFEKADAFWHLNKEFARRIRGDTKFVGNFMYPLQSLDTEELSSKRVVAIRKLVERVPVYYFQGNSSQLVDFVGERFN
jgi:hypothetical protein|tara:strand:- start:446 stop:1294 length:849 start_codon:yes stop_codon:yes gene_type:complete